MVQLSRREHIQSLLLSTFVLVLLQAGFCWILLVLNASIYQDHILVLFFLFGLLYPTIHFAAMWAVLGAGTLFQRQAIALAGLLFVNGIAMATIYGCDQVFNLSDHMFANGPLGRGGRLDLMRMRDGISTLEALTYFWLSFPMFFLICQLPYWIWSLSSTRLQIVRNGCRLERPLSISDLMFLTTLFAVATSGISYSIFVSESNQTSIGGIRIFQFFLNQTIYCAVSFLVLARPLICWILQDAKADRQERGVNWAALYLIGCVLLLSFGWAVWNKFLVHWSLIFLIAIPFATLGLPLILLLTQIRRLGFRLNTNH
ncbi:MAG: hypothetical protein AAGA30_00045 [Planctomycetota bacterium]